MAQKFLLVLSTLIILAMANTASCYAQSISIESSNAPAATKPAQTNKSGPASLGFTPVQKTDKAEAAKNEEVVPPGAKVVAHVVWVKGSFFASAAGTDVKRPLKISSNVYMNDTLITVSDSEAQVVFSDNSLMTFRPNSRLYISEYNYSPKNAKKEEKKSVGSYIMNLMEGGFRTITGFVAKDQPDNYQINTPVATIGVRGTEFSVVVEGTGKTFVKQYKGVPCVNAKNKKDKQNSVCMNDKNKYTEVENADSNPKFVAQQPSVFQVDVEVVPVVYYNQSPGFCGMQGCGSSGGGGFCIQ